MQCSVQVAWVSNYRNCTPTPFKEVESLIFTFEGPISLSASQARRHAHESRRASHGVERTRSEAHAQSQERRYTHTQATLPSQLEFLPWTAQNTWHCGRLAGETFCQGESGPAAGKGTKNNALLTVMDRSNSGCAETLASIVDCGPGRHSPPLAATGPACLPARLPCLPACQNTPSTRSRLPDRF